jgi:hypothetical protein
LGSPEERRGMGRIIDGDKKNWQAGEGDVAEGKGDENAKTKNTNFAPLSADGCWQWWGRGGGGEEQRQLAKPAFRKT